MKKLFRYFLLVMAYSCLLQPAYAQLFKPAFWNDIQQIKKRDSKQAPPKDAILFVGSSSIRLWKDLHKAFPEHTVLNRGFGGSTLEDLHRYLPDIVLPYQPKQVVIYSGENDLATDKVSPQEVLKRFDAVFQDIRKALPQVPITFISIKPSPSRLAFLEATIEANKLISQYLENQPNTQYVDVYSLMLDSQGKPRSDIFVEDRLHMNKKGYQIWVKAIAPHLRRNYERVIEVWLPGDKGMNSLNRSRLAVARGA